MPFKPNKKYTVVALYAAAVSAIAIICGVMLFNLPAVFSFCSRLLSGLSPVLYAGIVAFLMRPIVSRVERVLHWILGTERKKTEK
jgi:predicted PurR-regulated permease PerM